MATPPERTQTSGGSGGGGGSGGAAAMVAPRRAPRHGGDLGASVTDTTDVVRHGEITQGLADEVWKRCLKVWGVGDTNAGDRRELRDKLTLALVVSTSKDDENLNTQFRFGGRYLSVRTIYDEMARVVADHDSLLRVFVRSFDGAYFAIAMSDTLRNPGNMELRQEIAARSGVDVEYAYVAIDVFDAVIRHSGRQYSNFILQMYRSARAFRTETARAKSASIGMDTAPNDTSGRDRKAVTQQQSVEPPAKASPNTRLNFAPVR